VVGVFEVLAQEFADRLAAWLVSPLGEARIKVEPGGYAVEGHEKGEDVNHEREPLRVDAFGAMTPCKKRAAGDRRSCASGRINQQGDEED